MRVVKPAGSGDVCGVGMGIARDFKEDDRWYPIERREFAASNEIGGLRKRAEELSDKLFAVPEQGDDGYVCRIRMEFFAREN